MGSNPRPCSHTRDQCFIDSATDDIYIYPCIHNHSYIQEIILLFRMLARKREVSILVIHLTQPGFETANFGFPDLPKWETDALLIRPSHLVLSCPTLLCSLLCLCVESNQWLNYSLPRLAYIITRIKPGGVKWRRPKVRNLKFRS